MTVKCLSTGQKDAIATIYMHKAKSQKQMAQLLDVSKRTINRVLEERGLIVSSIRSKGASQGDDVIQLLYRHKVTVDQLKEMLEAHTSAILIVQSVSGHQTNASRKSPQAHNGMQRTLFDCPQGMYQ